MPAWLLPLCAKAARFALSAAEDPVQALLIGDDTGAGIGWHRDRPVFSTCGISLGAPTTMRFRRAALEALIAPPPSWLPDQFTI